MCLFSFCPSTCQHLVSLDERWMSVWSTGNLNRRAVSQGAQLNLTADTGHCGQESSMVLDQSRRINVVRKILLLVQSAQSRAWQHQETRSSVATCTCAQWVWCVDRWSAVTVAFDTLQLCADVNAFTRHEGLWWCPEEAVGVYSLIVLILHWNCSRDLLLNHWDGSVRAGSGLDNTLVYHPSSVRDAMLSWVVESMCHAVTVDTNEGESELWNRHNARYTLRL